MNRINGYYPGDFLDWREGSGGTVEIFDMEVGNANRRRGSGRTMVDTVITECEKRGVKTLYAITRMSNLIAQHFYTELRFRPVLLPDFYKDEPLVNGKSYPDAIMYVKDIGSMSDPRRSS